jgi:hypothetical protein
MKTIVPLLIAGFLLVAGSYPRDFYVDERTSTEVFFTVHDNMFPRHWYNDRIHAEVKPLNPAERQRVIAILQHAFAKYPGEVVQYNLDRVYVMRSMKFYGLQYGGTNARSTVYLTDDESNSSFTDLYIEGVFHHEFSSILKRSYPWHFDKEGWERANPPSFVYGKGGVNAILNGEASMKLDPSLFERGFLTKYSQASLEEDVNVFAQNLFTAGAGFWSAVDGNPRIRLKADLLIGFYNHLDPRFTEQYFRDINNAVAEGPAR